MPTPTSNRMRAAASRPGLTMLESLIATVILGVIVLAVAAALNASQKLAYEGQQRVLGVGVVDDMMIELMTVEYDDLPSWNGTRQEVGEMETMDGVPYTPAYASIGRTVTVLPEHVTEPGLGVTVAGLMVTVSADDGGHTLAEVSMFVPEPQQ